MRFVWDKIKCFFRARFNVHQKRCHFLIIKNRRGRKSAEIIYRTAIGKRPMTLIGERYVSKTKHVVFWGRDRAKLVYEAEKIIRNAETIYGQGQSCFVMDYRVKPEKWVQDPEFKAYLYANQLQYKAKINPEKAKALSMYLFLRKRPVIMLFPEKFTARQRSLGAMVSTIKHVIYVTTQESKEARAFKF